MSVPSTRYHHGKSGRSYMIEADPKAPGWFVLVKRQDDGARVTFPFPASDLNAIRAALAGADPMRRMAVLR